MSDFTQPIYVAIEPCRSVQTLVVILHLIPIAVAPLVFQLSLGLVALLGLLLLSLSRALSDYLLVENDLKSVLLLGNNRWIVSTRAKRHLAAEMTTAPFVTLPLIVLHLDSADGHHWHLVLTRANTPCQTLRRLRVRLSLPASDSE